MELDFRIALPTLGTFICGYVARLLVATCAVLFTLPGAVVAATSLAPHIPDTPAGQALMAWLNAFNSGDSEGFASFTRSHAPWLSTDQQMGLRASSGGYDLKSIEGSGRLWIVFHAKARVTGTRIFGSLAVRLKDPEHVTLLSLAPSDSKAKEIVLDGAQRDRLIAGAERLLTRFYVFPEIAKQTVAKLEVQRKRGGYQGITDGEVFAVRLEDDLRVASGDRHFAVDYFAKEMPPGEPGSRPHPDPRYVRASTRSGHSLVSDTL